MFSVSVRHFTYTVPSAIEGEPAEVAEAAKQQVQRLAAVVAELSTDTFVQLRSAGIDPDAEDAVKAWLDSDDGKAAADLIWGAQCFAEVAKAL
jgi:hypothetical protein